MLMVSSFLVLMPCWAAFWSNNVPVEGQPRDAAKIVSDSDVFSVPMNNLADSVGDPRGDRRDGQTSSESLVAPEPGGLRQHSATQGEEYGTHRGLEISSAASPDRAILGLKERLEGLGAAYMRLERRRDPHSGAAGAYHFVCRIPIPANRLYERTFEAVDSDAAAAMQRVVSEVELWRAVPTGSTQVR